MSLQTSELIDKLVTKERYDELTPYEQGYIWYMQAEHAESKIPKRCPYPKRSKERKQFERGSHTAMFAVLDGDDE